MKQSRRKFDSAFKAKVALEAIRERETLAGIAVKYDLHPTQISQWKQEFIEKSALLFDSKLPSSASEPAVDSEKLFAKIGQLEMERDFLKKSLAKLGVL
jgi:transposase